MKPLLGLCTAVGLSAQVFTGAVASQGFGYSRPAPVLGVATSGPRLDALAYWAPLHKVGLDDGYILWGQACVPIARGFGPAILVRYTRNSQWHRAAIYPSGCYSRAVPRVRITVMAHAPDVTSIYHGYGGTVGIAVPLGRFAWRTGFTLLRFHSPALGPFAGVAVVNGVSFDAGKRIRTE